MLQRFNNPQQIRLDRNRQSSLYAELSVLSFRGNLHNQCGLLGVKV